MSTALENRSFLKYSWFLVGMVFLVILAGGVVRMTQSGMGCPDWPRCFGMWIPPLHESQLPADFEKYLSKQDIDHSFNVYHTWIEYINRLLGAILGVFILINMVWAAKKFWPTDKRVVGVSFAMLIAVGFQGWLGKTVVESNLSEVKITIHMLVAILIAVLPLFNIARLQESRISVPKKVRYVLWAMLGLMIIQIVLGTRVREQIDEISKELFYKQRSLWIERLDGRFIIHRSFSWLIVIGSVILTYFSKPIERFRNYWITIVCSIAVAVLLGIVMAHLSVPAIAQPLHLVVGCLMVVAVVYSLLRTQVKV